MHAVTREILEKLAAKVNLADGLLPSFDVPVSPARFRKYHESSVAIRAEVHEDLRQLERAGWLKVTFKKISFSSVETIQRISVIDTAELLKTVGDTSLSERIESAVRTLKKGIDELALPSNYDDVPASAESLWRSNKLYFNCRPDDVARLVDAFRVVKWILEQDGERQIDYRTLSSRLLTDSKVLERNISLVERLLAIVAPADAPCEKSGDLLAYYSVSRFPPSFRFRGAVTVTTPRGELKTGGAWPFIEVPPDGTSFIAVDPKATSYVLFIENKSSFERHCREIEDNGLIIYTNGFPSRSWQRLIKQITMGLPDEMPVFHWGDIDPGGYRIFQFIAQLCDRDVMPHQMDQFKMHSGEGRVVKVSDLVGELSKHEHGGVTPLMDKLNQFEADGLLEWLEQEEQSPMPPIA